MQSLNHLLWFLRRGARRLHTDTDAPIAPQWLSANMVVSSFAIGALAVTVFRLGFVDAFLTILFINLLGITPVAFFSTFGPRYGLRQMVLSRFFFGFYGVKLSTSWIEQSRGSCGHPAVIS